MRIKVRFVLSKPVAVPINQNYFLASAIYKTLEPRADYAKFLHDHGYIHNETGRAFKLFTFSPLMCRNRHVNGDNIILGPGDLNWIISSPMEEFAMALAEGLLSQGVICFKNAILPIDRIESDPAVEFESDTYFSCISPIVLTRPSDGYALYLDHTAPDFSTRIRQNLIKKYEIIHNQYPPNDAIALIFDPEYIERHANKVTKLIDIRGTKIRGILSPFRLQGSKELMVTAYEAGIGEKNSMGFGCLERKN